MSFDTGLAVGLAIGKKKFSGGTSDDNWVYYADWIPIPEPASNQVTAVVTSIWTHSVFFGTQNTEGAMTIDWGDGNVETVPNQYTPPNHVYVDGTGTITNNGSEQWLVTITAPSSRGGIYVNQYSAAPYLLAISYGSNYTTMGNYTFNDSNLLHYVKFSNGSMLADYMFSYCTALKIIEFDVPPTIIPNRCFNSCFSLEKIDLSEVITLREYALSYCNRLRKLDLPKCTIIYADSLSWSLGVVEINAPLLTTIGNDAVLGCHALRKFNSPSLLTVGTRAFTYDYNLTAFTYSTGCTFGTGAFEQCYNLFPIPV